jgi:hypothetical protein
MGKVTTAEAKHLHVGQWLKQKGYGVTTHGGNENLPDSNPGSFCYFDIRLTLLGPKQFLFFKWQGPSHYNAAELYLRLPRIGARDGNWIIHVIGRRFVEHFTELANELSREFKVNVHVRLEKEEPDEIVPNMT